MNVVDDNLIAKDRTRIDIDVYLAEREDVFAVVAIRVADIEASKCAVARQDRQVDRFQADRCLSDLWTEFLNACFDAFVECA